MKRLSQLIVVVGALTFGALTDAAPVWEVPLPGGYLDVDYFAGSGSQTAYFVMDFGGNGGGTYAFGFRFEGAPTAAEALNAIASAGALEFTADNFGSPSEPDLFIASVAYDSEFDMPNFDVDSRFWNYSLGVYAAQDVSWASSEYGISGREFGDFGNNNGTPNEILQVLTDGQFHGFYAGASFPSIPVAVPEPSGAVLMMIGAGICLRRRRGSAKMPL